MRISAPRSCATAAANCSTAVAAGSSSRAPSEGTVHCGRVLAIADGHAKTDPGASAVHSGTRGSAMVFAPTLAPTECERNRSSWPSGAPRPARSTALPRASGSVASVTARSRSSTRHRQAVLGAAGGLVHYGLVASPEPHVAVARDRVLDVVHRHRRISRPPDLPRIVDRQILLLFDNSGPAKLLGVALNLVLGWRALQHQPARSFVHEARPPLSGRGQPDATAARTRLPRGHSYVSANYRRSPSRASAPRWGCAGMLHAWSTSGNRLSW